MIEIGDNLERVLITLISFSLIAMMVLGYPRRTCRDCKRRLEAERRERDIQD